MGIKNKVDLSRHNEGVKMQVLDETDKPVKGCTITLKGIDSDTYRQIADQNGQKRLNQAQRGRVKMTVEEIKEESYELLASCTVSWEGVFDANDQPLPCTWDNAKLLYQEAPYLYEQVNQFVGDRRNFLPPASKSSSKPSDEKLNSTIPTGTEAQPATA